MKDKKYYVQQNVGKSKYVVSYFDGVSKYEDGSDFYDIRTFKSKRELAKEVKRLLAEGYTYKYC